MLFSAAAVRQLICARSVTTECHDIVVAVFRVQYTHGREVAGVRQELDVDTE